MAAMKERNLWLFSNSMLCGIRSILLVILVLVFGFGCSSHLIKDTDHELTSSNQDDYGKPCKVKIKQPPDADTQDIAFGLIADTHINMGNCQFDTDNMKRARDVANDINIDCKNENCLGVVHLGDLVNGHETQYVVAFRQIFEDDYPGKDGGAIAGCSDKNYDAYSKGKKIKFPVFPTLGNHDIAKSEGGWHKARDYIGDRIIGASHLLDHYKSVNYVWRWGQYVFFQLGQWAGSNEWEEKGAIDDNKIRWLRSALKKHVGNSGLGVFICQHYGWDGSSKNKKWWNDEQRQREINVLCRRTDDDSKKSTCVPYNVLAFITGHSHNPGLKTIEAGKDSKGNDVKFNNYVMQSSGEPYKHNNKDSGLYGFSIMHMYPDKDKDKLDGMKLTMHTKTMRMKKDGKKQVVGWSKVEKPFTLGIKDEPDSFRFTVGRNLKSDGTTDSWDSMINRPFSGDTEFGGGAVFTDIDHNTSDINTSDIVLVGIDSQPGFKRFYYRIGYNLKKSGNFSSWGSVKYSPNIGSLTAGGGAAAADFDGNGKPELILMYIDAPDGADEFRYMIGWNLDTEGNPANWSHIVHGGPSPGTLTAGGGAAIADIDGNGRLDLLLMSVDNPKGANEFRYTIGWNLDTNGNPESWSDIIHGSSPGFRTTGAGAAITHSQGGTQLDLLLMAIDDPLGVE